MMQREKKRLKTCSQKPETLWESQELSMPLSMRTEFELAMNLMVETDSSYRQGRDFISLSLDEGVRDAPNYL